MSGETRNGDSLRAAATLIKSSRARNFASIVLTLVVLPAAGWVSAKLDTTRQVAALERDNSILVGKVAALENQRDDLNRRIDALSAPIVPGVSQGGLITQLQQEIRYAQRNAVRATAIALAFERDKTKKCLAAEKPLQAFDNRIADGKAPSDAAETAITKIALP